MTAAPAAAPPAPARLSPQAARLSLALAAAARTGRTLLGACLPAGWPPALADGHAVCEQVAADADIVALTLPALHGRGDGPVIRAAHRAALAAGWQPGHAPALVRRLAAGGTLVLVIGHWRTVASAGPAELAAALGAAGAAGMIIPDLPAPAAATWTGAAAAAGLHTIPLAGPEAPPAWASGAVYLPAGPARPTPGSRIILASQVRRLQARTGLPVLAGTGISTSAHAVQAARAGAAAVIVGSALLAAITSHPDNPAGAASTVAARFRAVLIASRPPGEGGWLA